MKQVLYCLRGLRPPPASSQKPREKMNSEARKLGVGMVTEGGGEKKEKEMHHVACPKNLTKLLL